MYDFIIVGGGPGGLTHALVLADFGYKVCLLERDETLGGCHKVLRVGQQQLFTEHGPRIYDSNYLSTYELLNQIGCDTSKLFVPYSIAISNFNQDIFQVLSVKEILAFVTEFIIFLFVPSRSMKMTVQDLMDRWNFSAESQDLIERLCRLTDGAGPKRYTLFEFLQLVNQYAFYEVQQPTIPNDKGIICAWTSALKERGVDIFTNAEVIGINACTPHSNKIDSVCIKNKRCTDRSSMNYLSAKNFIFNIPLTNFANLLGAPNTDNLIRNSFGDFNELQNFAKKSEYITYIPIVFYWKDKLEIPPKWGYPKHDWEVAIVILSDYMKHITNQSYQTVFSTCICNTNTISRHTGKSANQTADQNEVISEVFRQVKEIYKDLPPPDVSIMSPEMWYDSNKQRWNNEVKAFVLTTEGFFPQQRSNNFENMYLTGTFSGYSPNSFTTMESAVTNALHLLHQLVPESSKKYPIKRPMTIRKVLGMMGLGASLIYFFKKSMVKNYF